MVFVSLYSICSRKYLMVYTGTVLVLSGKYTKTISMVALHINSVIIYVLVCMLILVRFCLLRTIFFQETVSIIINQLSFSDTDLGSIKIIETKKGVNLPLAEREGRKHWHQQEKEGAWRSEMSPKILLCFILDDICVIFATDARIRLKVFVWGLY